MNGNRIIVHALIKVDDKYLVLKRSSNEDTFPNVWDIPGGLAEYGELPREALIREAKEEIGLDMTPIKVIHEDSNLDKDKNLIFARLVYLGELKEDISNIKLQLEEHSEYKLISSLDELEGEEVVFYLNDLIK